MRKWIVPTVVILAGALGVACGDAPLAPDRRITPNVDPGRLNPPTASIAQLGHGNPALTRARILQSADDLGEPGTDPYYGRGRINIARALGFID